MLPEMSLFWCAIPLLLLPWLSAPERLGMAVSRIVVAGFALGALQVGTGSLGSADLDSWAAREGNAGFVALTLGVLISGALVPTTARARFGGWLPGLPLMLASAPVLIGIGLHGAGALGIGLVLGALPSVAALIRHRCGSCHATSTVERPASSRGVGLAVGCTIVAIWAVAAWGGPILVVTFGLAALLLLSGWRVRASRARSPWPVASVIGAGGLAGFAWLAVTIAGQPFVVLRGYGLHAPLSPAAEQWLGTLLAVTMLGTFAPWPWHRWGDARATFPIAIAFTHAVATMVAPEGVRGWLPLLTIVLVPSAILGLLGRRWDGAAGALAALAALRSGPWATTAAHAVVLWPTLCAIWPSAPVGVLSGEWITFRGARLGVTSAAVGAALTVAVVLRDEVVLGTILAAGLALTAPLVDRPRVQSAAAWRP